MPRDRFCALYHSGMTSWVGKRAETYSALFIIQEQQAEWVNAQRQILRPLSFKKWAMVSGGMQRQIMVILYLTTQAWSFPTKRRDKLWSFCVFINREEQIQQYQDDVSVLIIFKFLQVLLARRFTGWMVFRSNEISVLSLLPFYLQ